MKKRLIGLGIVLTVFFAALIVRLVFVQIVSGAEYRNEAQKRQRVSMTGLAIRGVIYDRNMEPLTNRVKTFIYLVPKSRIDEQVRMLLDKVGAERISDSNMRYDVYQSSRQDDDVNAKLTNKYEVFLFSMNKRYEEGQCAEHMIGYINAHDNKGQTGIEKVCDELLRVPDNSYYIITDGKRRVLPGYGMNLNPDIKQNGIVATLDYEMQKKVEDVMREEDVNGSAVILDTKTGELLAAVSLPSYDPNRVEDYINSLGGELMNKTIRGEYAPGSVFKIVTLAAALESGKYKEDTVFFCKGYEEINGVKIACSSESAGGHGEITLNRAFQLSCNAAFMQIGVDLGGREILTYASKFGLGKKALTGFSEEKPGNLPAIYETAGAGVGNLSIGQGELLATPIQIARMTNVIAAGGKDMGIHVLQAELEDGRIIKEYPRQEVADVISEESARRIRVMMAGVIQSGTGDNIRLTPGLTAGGKTSSAQSADSGQKVVHAWFSGFVPADDPKYTITVFVKNGKSGRQSAAPIFEKLVNQIM